VTLNDDKPCRRLRIGDSICAQAQRLRRRDGRAA
jgi:hypothetical protein